MLDIGTVLLCLWLKGLLDEICFWNWKLFLSLAISSMVLWRGANLTISEFIAVYMRNKSTFPSGEDTQRHGQRRERVFIDFGNIFLYGPRSLSILAMKWNYYYRSNKGPRPEPKKSCLGWRSFICQIRKCSWNIYTGIRTPSSSSFSLSQYYWLNENFTNSAFSFSILSISMAI